VCVTDVDAIPGSHKHNYGWRPTCDLDWYDAMRDENFEDERREFVEQVQRLALNIKEWERNGWSELEEHIVEHNGNVF
jgi:hypothetical protein